MSASKELFRSRCEWGLARLPIDEAVILGRNKETVMRHQGWILVMSGVVCSLFEARAQIVLSGSAYSENFDGLSSTGTGNAWSDHATIPGWYAGSTSGFGGDYRAGSGTSTTGDLYSFGTGSDRALGSLASSGSGGFAYGVRLQNGSGQTLGGFVLSYHAEQWRDSRTSVQTLEFSYKISSTALTAPEPAHAPGVGGWVGLAGLNFASPQFAASGALDGNAAANRQSFLAVGLTGATLNPGEELFLRWTDADDTGSDHAFGIDNFSIAYSAVPEPEEITMVTGAVLLGAWGFASRWRQGRSATQAGGNRP